MQTFTEMDVRFNHDIKCPLNHNSEDIYGVSRCIGKICAAWRWAESSREKENIEYTEEVSIFIIEECKDEKRKNLKGFRRFFPLSIDDIMPEIEKYIKNIYNGNEGCTVEDIHYKSWTNTINFVVHTERFDNRRGYCGLGGNVRFKD